jgi:ribosome-interacting GTPase 1
MPANLPPVYLEAERKYREAKTPEAKLEALEEMLAVIPKHKGTDKLRADLRRRRSKFKDQAQKKKGASRQKTAYAIEKEGAAQVAVIGFPNTGKSSLLSVLTKASPDIADFPHSTHKPTPGMATYENIQFQLVDTPPMAKDYVDPAMADFIRRADILVIMVDLEADPLQQLEDTMAVLESIGVFPRGGAVPDNLTKTPFIKSVLIVANKMDDDEGGETFEIFMELCGMELPSVGISTRTGRNLAAFLKALFELSEVVRVYTKVPGKEPDMDQPFVVPNDSTLEELASKIHKDFVSKLKHAKIWGVAVRDGQMVQKDYVLHNGDIVELHV